MEDFLWNEMIKSFDARRDIVIPGGSQETVQFCTRQFLQIGKEAIRQRGAFVVALSGGQTPQAIFSNLSRPPYREMLDWTKVFCFWSDERSVPPDHPDSNYHNAMKAGLAQLPIPKEQIFRMPAEENIEKNALTYERLIREKVPSLNFDLIMLGMGEDGHTASLFPHTPALHTTYRLVVANYVPEKKTWRMTMTYECIQQALHICLAVMGENKAHMVAQALTGPYEPENWPVQRVGTPTHKALWILDSAASKDLNEMFQADQWPLI